ncbi:MAG: glycerate kinase, partial [Akkermansiaceae bacterium]|nr:glycerate kinase [Akkermansiaceae bacterium]
MRILIACDKFKGSLAATEACEAIRDGLTAAGVSAEFDLCPIADGGEGFAAAMVAALGGRWRSCAVHDALGRRITARYGLGRSHGTPVAVMEMAEASGYLRISPEERDILHASTAGTGQMIRHAVQVAAVERILIGIGGSATNDGGVGMAAALGIAFRDARGEELRPVPAAMGALAEICEGGRIDLPPIEVACDVTNPLLGPNGATAVYGPQKGAGEAERGVLEEFLE